MKNKKLIINDVLYCHYQIDKNILHLKIRNNLKGYDEYYTEQFCYNVICGIESRDFAGMSYLNIK